MAAQPPNDPLQVTVSASNWFRWAATEAVSTLRTPMGALTTIAVALIWNMAWVQNHRLNLLEAQAREATMASERQLAAALSASQKDHAAILQVAATIANDLGTHHRLTERAVQVLEQMCVMQAQAQRRDVRVCFRGWPP